MNASIIETSGVKRIKLEGTVVAAEAPNFANFIDQNFAQGNKSAIWDLSGLDGDLDNDGVAVLVEAFARLKADNSPVIILNAPERIVGILNSIGLGRVLSFSDDEKDAMVQFFRSFEKKYDDSFFQLLIREGYISAEQLQEAHEEYSRCKGKTPIDEIMLDMGLLTVEDILHVMMKRKTFLGEILVDAGLITKGTLEQVLAAQDEKGGKLGDHLKEIGAVTDRDIYEALAIQYWRKTELASDEDSEISIGERINFLSSDDYLIVNDSEEHLIAAGPIVMPTLLEHLERKDLAYRSNIARILGEIRDGRSVTALGNHLTSEEQALKDEAYWGLVKLSGQELAVSATWRWGRWISSNAGSIGEAKELDHMEDKDWQLIFAELCEGQRPLDDFTLEYEAGKINWEGGKVNLLIDGTGRALLKRNCRGDITLTSTAIQGVRIKELLGSLYENKVWEIRTTRTFGDLNEPRHAFTFHCGPTKRLSVFYWATEMYGNLSLMNIENSAKVLLRYLAL